MTTTNRGQNAASFGPRSAFTLVELLVVITIISILASLITVAAIRALSTARQAAIKTELSQISTGFERYKDKANSYPPNAVTDPGPAEPALDTTQILNDLRRHLRQAFPSNREPDTILVRLAGLAGPGVQQLDRGMTAEEAIVFWLGGFSADPKYPISGEGGPSFRVGDPEQIEGRSWIYPFDVTRLGPRDASGNFAGRYIEYDVSINGQPAQTRRINFWRYHPARSQVDYVYFDTSRYTPEKLDPPASAGLHVHAIKRIENPGANERVLFANADKFQVLHCGIDDRWGDLADYASYDTYVNNRNLFLAYPTGPFTGDLADTVVNFVTQSRLEDAQQ